MCRLDDTFQKDWRAHNKKRINADNAPTALQRMACQHRMIRVLLIEIRKFSQSALISLACTSYLARKFSLTAITEKYTRISTSYHQLGAGQEW